MSKLVKHLCLHLLISNNLAHSFVLDVEKRRKTPESDEDFNTQDTAVAKLSAFSFGFSFSPPSLLEKT